MDSSFKLYPKTIFTLVCLFGFFSPQEIFGAYGTGHVQRYSYNSYRGGQGRYVYNGGNYRGYYKWPRYYAYYGGPAYYTYPYYSTYSYSYPSYYTNYIYPSYPYEGYYYQNGSIVSSNPPNSLSTGGRGVFYYHP